MRFVRFTEDCKRLVTGGDDGVTMVWSCPDGQILQRISGHKSAVVAATFAEIRSYPVPPIITASILGKVFLWLPDQGLKGFLHYK